MQADALRLPIRSDGVDCVIATPPFPGNGVWENDYWVRLAEARREMERVVRSGGSVFCLIRRVWPKAWWVQWDGPEEIYRLPGRTQSSRFGGSWTAPCEEDTEDLILGYTVEGEVVLNPFGGTGTVAAVASDLRRVGIDSDISMEQAQIAKWRGDA